MCTLYTSRALSQWAMTGKNEAGSINRRYSGYNRLFWHNSCCWDSSYITDIADTTTTVAETKVTADTADTTTGTKDKADTMTGKRNTGDTTATAAETTKIQNRYSGHNHGYSSDSGHNRCGGDNGYCEGKVTADTTTNTTVTAETTKDTEEI